MGPALEHSVLMCTEVGARLLTGAGGAQKGGREERGRGREDAAVRASLVGSGLSKAETEIHHKSVPFVKFRANSGAGFLW